MKLVSKIFNVFFNKYRRHLGYGVGYKIEASGELNIIKYVREFYRPYDGTQLIICDIGANNGLWSQTVLDTFPQNISLHN